MTFQLTCTVCQFETVVDVDVDAVFDEIEKHQAQFEEDHFVDFERLPDREDDPGAAAGGD